MSPENFCYWLQGALELGKQVTFERDQVLVIQDHLDLVFDKKTPSRLTDLVDRFKDTPITTLPYPMPRAPVLMNNATC